MTPWHMGTHMRVLSERFCAILCIRLYLVAAAIATMAIYANHALERFTFNDNHQHQITLMNL